MHNVVDMAREKRYRTIADITSKYPIEPACTSPAHRGHPPSPSRDRLLSFRITRPPRHRFPQGFRKIQINRPRPSSRNLSPFQQQQSHYSVGSALAVSLNVVGSLGGQRRYVRTWAQLPPAPWALADPGGVLTRCRALCPQRLFAISFL